MTSKEQQQSELIDLTDFDNDDEMVPESLRSIVADMDNRLANEHLNFLSVAAVDPVVDDTITSPEATPGLNPAAGIQQVRSSDIFTPKPSLFAEDNTLIDFAATNFTSPPPPSYEMSVAHKKPATSLPPRPPSPPKISRSSPSLMNDPATTQPQTAPRESNPLVAVSESLLKDPLTVIRQDEPKLELSNPVSSSTTATPVVQSPTAKPEPCKQQDTKSPLGTPNDNLEFLLAKDAVKCGLPPPTPASTVTGPQPLETPPRAPPTNVDTPSPLSMSSRESPMMTPPAKPSPQPPRFSPSPIEQTSDAKFTRETANHLSNGSKSSRQEALAKKIAVAKKSPDKPKSLAQRLFASVDKITRVAPAPSRVGELKVKPVPTSAKTNVHLGESKAKSVQAELDRKSVQQEKTTPAPTPFVAKPIEKVKESPKPKEILSKPISVNLSEVSKPKNSVVSKPKSSQPHESTRAVVKSHDQEQSHSLPTTAASHFMVETAASAAKPAPTKEAMKHIHLIKSLPSSSHLLQPTTATTARSQRLHDTAEESFQEQVASPEKVRPLDPASHLLQSTSSMEARKIHTTQPAMPRSSPQRVKALPSTSHLLQATIATQAWKTERKQRPLPPAPPARRVVTGASDRLTKPTTASQMKVVEEGVAKAKERIRQRKLQSTVPLNRIQPPDSSRTSNASKRSLTIPKSPKFATKGRQPPVQDETKQSLHNSLAECDSLFGKSLRSSDAPSVGTSSTSRRPKDLTIPISPRFTTDARHESRPKPDKSSTADVSLAHSTRVLQQSLRSTTMPPPSRKRKKGLTRGISPKFSTITRRALPKSTEERELEEMKKFQQTPFRARPYPGITDRPGTFAAGTMPSFMKPTQGQIARKTACAPKTGPSTLSNSTFKARPAPLSTFQEPNVKPKKHSPTTATKPFSLQTSTRVGGLHTQMTETARKRAEERALERQAKNELKEADEVAAIRRKHAAELRREREKRNRLVAKLSPHNIPSENKKRTDPRPFQLASSSRHESAREERLRKQAGEEEIRRKQASFRAKPVPKTTYEVRPLATSPMDVRPRHYNEENHSEKKVVPIETIFCDVAK